MAQLKARLEEHTTAFELMASSSAKLDELARLEPDWDSYGARPMTAIAINQANKLLIDVARHYLELGLLHVLRTKPWFIAPLADGGIQIEWKSNRGALEVEIGGDGQIGYLIEPPTGQFENAGNEQATNWAVLVDTICQFLA